MKKRNFSWIAAGFGSLAAFTGAVVPQAPSLLPRSLLPASAIELSVAGAILAGLGTFIGLWVFFILNRREEEQPIDVNAIAQRMRAFEEHEQIRRKRRTQTLHYDEFRAQMPTRTILRTLPFRRS